MRLRKKIIIFFIIMALMINFSMIFSITTFAHPSILNVGYDGCFGDKYNDSELEMWYALNYDGQCRHISHEETTIKYYLADHTRGNTSATWVNLVQTTSSTELSTKAAQQIALEIKNSYADSMEKWNNVYFYTYDSSGIIVKNKLINVIQVASEDEANLTIYPEIDMDSVAVTTPLFTSGISQDESGTVAHTHYVFWTMAVNIEYFYEHYNFGDENDNSDDKHYDAASVQLVREAAGAHELGHVLGLQDLDANNLCGSIGINEAHHLELLMGYGKPIYNRCPDITYKDIAGVAITRGFHTDADHKWLGWGEQYDGTYKLICSICNAVKYVTNPSDYIYLEGQDCYMEHELSSGNMMPVASYGTKDYYKCKYCRYVAPFDDIVEQNYVYSSVSSTQHQCTNEVDGLRYSFLEAHTYGRYFTPNNKLFHNSHCDCGQPITQRHVISPNDVGQTNQWCKYCGELLVGSGTLNGVYTDYPHTENGSYILPSGVIVLVPEDEEAYLNGTLEFRTGEIM